MGGQGSIRLLVPAKRNPRPIPAACPLMETFRVIDDVLEYPSVNARASMLASREFASVGLSEFVPAAVADQTTSSPAVVCSSSVAAAKAAE